MRLDQPFQCFRLLFVAISAQLGFSSASYASLPNETFPDFLLAEGIPEVQILPGFGFDAASMPAMRANTSHFRTVQKFKSEYAPAEFSLYESERTGMRVVVVDRKGPKVSGYFALATEIHDDSGAPHTLEHLVFMGSRSYKYKGVLDRLATRAYSYTNAWTATDHTAYTLDSAGWDGFAQILPVYLEHVLLPTLTDSGCYTEVHHVDGEGNDAGVVYSEMQGVQNTQSELMDLKARRVIYPEGNGFRYETGGMMEQLRVLTADRIRAFHKEMYQPKNLCLVLIGEVDHDNLLQILDDFEDGIVDEMPSTDAPFHRPWVDSKRTPPLNKTTVETVEFPEEDESSGEVLMGFLGPECNDELLVSAVDTMMIYLAGSSVSVLENTLVEKEQLASAVYYQRDTRDDVVIWFTLSSVATEKLADVEKRFFNLLKDTAHKPLDMGYMKECLARLKRQVLYTTESSHTCFADPVIEDHLFGTRSGSTLRESLQTMKWFDALDEWTDDDWRVFLSKWLADAHHVSILGVPSEKLSKKLKDDETARVAKQKERLGEDGLKKLAERLKSAQTENDKEIPPELLEKFEIPGTGSIHFIPSITARSGLAKDMGTLDNEIQHVVNRDAADLPLFIHFEHIPTNFVHLSLILSTSPIPLELKPLMSVYIMNFFNTPIMRDGVRVDFEQVVTELERDTVSYSLDSGSRIGNAELIRIKMIVEQSKYEAAIGWMKTMLFDSVFDETRLHATLTKMLADIPEEKRSGNSMAYAVDAITLYEPASIARAQSTLVKALYLKRIKRLLKDDPSAVIAKMEQVRHSLCRFGNLRVLVMADLHQLAHPVSAWSPFVHSSHLDATEPLRPLDTRAAVLSPAARHPGRRAVVVPMPTVDSSFALLTARGLDSYDHPQLPALLVALAYLDAVEGPLWVGVRGTGLAYGTGFGWDTAMGLVTFRVYRSPDASRALAASKAVVAGFAEGRTELDRLALEGAISSIVLGFAEEQPTAPSAGLVGFVNQVVKGIPKDWSDGMLRRVRAVGVDEIRKVLQEVVMKVFVPEEANLVVTCATIMAEGLSKNLAEAGYEPKIRDLASFQDDYGLKPQDGEDEDDGDSEEDDEDDDEEDASEGADEADIARGAASVSITS